ncbi:DedA family protein [Cellulosimicrobium cellulans]|uniref:DedA family protein n=1 Tax=Cellulosimicrobium cellulans TaxID=1710 RepID=UPI001EDBEF62|nr:DedA family protein [Cellulosimicrobium cellulans]UKJ64031.1 DedA family protein [Cellulosimicrobium cellulans]
MPDAVSTFLENLETWILALAASAWIYPALFGFATIDGFFPPIPSESVVITLAVSAHATGEPNLLLVLLVAAAGAWTGDQIAFSIGRAIGTDRVRFLRSPRGRKAVAWAERALAHRGASFILAARYIPIGRVAVNMTAGAVGYPRRRFMAFSGIAAVTWAVYSVLIGLVAAQWLGHEPLLAMVVGVVLGVATGFVIDRVLMMRARHRGELPVVVPVPAAPTSGDPALQGTSAAVTGTVGSGVEATGVEATGDDVTGAEEGVSSGAPGPSPSGSTGGPGTPGAAPRA